MENCCFTKHLFINGWLEFQVYPICQKISSTRGHELVGRRRPSWRLGSEAFGGFKGRSEVPPLIDDYEVVWMRDAGCGSG